jgi:hypothetical protein
LQSLVVEFDAAVDQVVRDGVLPNGTLAVSSYPDGEWERCVANRAAMISAKITPILIR